MDDEGLLAQRGNVLIGGHHRVNPALSWCGEHCRVGLVETGSNAGPVPDLSKLVGDELPGEGEVVHDSAHRRDRGLVPPDCLEPLGDREGHAHGSHQGQPVHPFGVLARDVQGDGAAEAVAHQTGPFDPQGVQEPDQLV